MQINGRRICIAGSASFTVNPVLLSYAHELVREAVLALIREGALLLCGVGKNPIQVDQPGCLPLIFDWTILDAIAMELKAERIASDKLQGHLLAAVLTSKTSKQIPSDKLPAWNYLLETNAITVHYINPGWASGAIRRQYQEDLCDILIVIGGGEGVEHLAQEFTASGKPVIPLDLPLGASKGDGAGGACKLFNEMRSKPDAFVRTAKTTAAGAILTRMETCSGLKPIKQVVQALIDLIHELLPPDAFYVRLLNTQAENFNSVERYFRNVVDPVVEEFGYHSVEMGSTESSSPWMNVQIFKKIHYSGVTIVDLTGVRPNCLMELGYAFGRERRVIITAKEGTAIPFDASAIEVRLWNESTALQKQIEELRAYWKRNANRPPLVTT